MVTALSMDAEPWSEKERGEQLLDLFSGLVQAHGVERLLGAPFIEETPKFFPDSWEPTLVGAARILHRLLCYVGVEGWELELVDARDPLADEGIKGQQQPVIDFIEAENGKMVFQVDNLGRAEWVPAVLCYEAALAFVATRQAAHPYRGGDRPADAVSQKDHEQAAAATVFLGLGLITVNAAHAFHQDGEIVGNMAVTYRTHMILGALPAGDLSFLLAVQLCLRGTSVSAAAPLLRQLQPNQAQAVRRWLAALGGSRDALRTRLGFPEPAPMVDALALPEVPPLPAHTVSALEEAEEVFRNPLRGESAVRYYEAKTITYLFVGLFAAMVPAGWLAFAGGSRIYIALAVLAVGAGAGALIGSRLRLHYCGACDMVLRARETTCPQCAARLEGDEPRRTLARLREQPEEEEDEEEEDELVRQALEQERRDFGEDGEV